MKYASLAVSLLIILFFGCGNSTKDVAGAYETKDVKIPLEGDSKWHKSSKWVLDIFENGRFSLDRENFKISAHDKTVQPIPMQNENINGTWELDSNKLKLTWRESSIIPQVKEIEDLTKTRTWAWSDGQSYRGTLVGVEEVNGEVRPLVKLEESGRTFSLSKDRLPAAEWHKFQQYRNAIAKYGATTFTEDIYQDVDMLVVFDVETSGDLICEYAGDSSNSIRQQNDNFRFSVEPMEDKRFQKQSNH